MKILAFIPARGGSKGIPRKNLVPLGGKPLIQYTIEAAQESSLLDAIFLSTDNREIMDFCISCGLGVPYQRPEHLAADDSPMMDAVVDALRWLSAQGGKNSKPDAVLLLQPTSPLRTAQDIDRAIGQFIANSSESLLGVHAMREHPSECIKKGAQGQDWEYLAVHSRVVTRRQDYLDEFYFINGAIYLATTDFILCEQRFVTRGVTDLFIMDPSHGVDIDDLYGLQYAEFLLNEKTVNGGLNDEYNEGIPGMVNKVGFY
jgi:N-acylneuraminate cytidylyltransferase/CMP-N,N'-diacetyllegionaminic acid synthase